MPIVAEFLQRLWTFVGIALPVQPREKPAVFLIRKVDLALWEPPPTGFKEHEVHAEILQKELRATGNELSFWRFDSAVASWQDDAVIAIVGGWKAALQGIHIAWILEEDVTQAGVAMEARDGDTCIEAFKKNHVDLKTLDTGRLHCVAQLIAKSIRANKTFSIRTREEVLQLLVDAVGKRRLVKADHLRGTVKEIVKSALNK